MRVAWIIEWKDGTPGDRWDAMPDAGLHATKTDAVDAAEWYERHAAAEPAWDQKFRVVKYVPADSRR